MGYANQIMQTCNMELVRINTDAAEQETSDHQEKLDNKVTKVLKLMHNIQTLFF